MQSKVKYLYHVFVTPNGEVFFCDTYNHRVKKILRTGETVTICGTGIGGYNGDDQPATQAQLKEPSSVFVSSRNEVYISELAGQRIRKILTNGNIVAVTGDGTYGYNEDDIPATEARLYNACGICVNERDELYFAEYGNNCIRKVCNGMITTVVGYTELNTPSGVFISKSNEIYIANNGGHKIKKVNSNGIVSTIAGTGEGGYNGDGDLATKTQLSTPWGVTVANDEVYIADLSNNRIRKVLRNGNIITISTIAGTGVDGYNGDGILATSAQLEGPIGLFVTRNNEIFISEYHGHRIRKHNNWYGQCTIEPFIKKNASSASIFLRVVSNDIEMTAWIDDQSHTT